jgi:hypothetical protein
MKVISMAPQLHTVSNEMQEHKLNEAFVKHFIIQVQPQSVAYCSDIECIYNPQRRLFPGIVTE